MWIDCRSVNDDPDISALTTALADLGKNNANNIEWLVDIIVAHLCPGVTEADVRVWLCNYVDDIDEDAMLHRIMQRHSNMTNVERADVLEQFFNVRNDATDSEDIAQNLKDHYEQRNKLAQINVAPKPNKPKKKPVVIDSRQPSSDQTSTTDSVKSTDSVKKSSDLTSIESYFRAVSAIFGRTIEIKDVDLGTIHKILWSLASHLMAFNATDLEEWQDVFKWVDATLDSSSSSSLPSKPTELMTFASVCRLLGDLLAMDSISIIESPPQLAKFFKWLDMDADIGKVIDADDNNVKSEAEELPVMPVTPKKKRKYTKSVSAELPAAKVESPVKSEELPVMSAPPKKKRKHNKSAGVPPGSPKKSEDLPSSLKQQQTKSEEMMMIMAKLEMLQGEVRRLTDMISDMQDTLSSKKSALNLLNPTRIASKLDKL